MSRRRVPPASPISSGAPALDGREAQYVMECLETTWISSNGRFIGAFEAAVAEFLDVRHAVAVSNGTTALHLALVASGRRARRRGAGTKPNLHRQR